MNIYLKLKEEQQKKIEAFPVFFAFNDKQMEEGLKKLNITIKDIRAIGGGGYIRKKDNVKLNKLMDDNEKEQKKMLNNEKYVYEMFKYELANHEFCYTYDYTDILSALGLTLADIDKNKFLRIQLLKAKNDYLKNCIF